MKTQTLVRLLSVTLALPAAAESKLCQAFLNETYQPTPISSVTKPSPKRLPQLTGPEAYMVQMAVLFDHDLALSPEAAAHIFFDTKHDSDTGSIDYMSVLMPNGTETKIANVVYFPGDNPYGLVFEVIGEGDDTRVKAFMSNQDGDFTCLRSY